MIQHEAALKNHSLHSPDLGVNQTATNPHTQVAPSPTPSATPPVQPAPQGLIAILLSPTVIYALLSTGVITIVTLVLLSIYDRETYDLIVSVVKKLVGLTPTTKG